MSPEKIVIGRVILLFWNGSLFLGGHVSFRFFSFFSQNLCVASTWVFLEHALLVWKRGACSQGDRGAWNWALHLFQEAQVRRNWFLKALSWQRIRGFSFKSLGTCRDVIVDSTCMSAYGPFSLMVPFRSAKNRLSGPMSVVSLPIHSWFMTLGLEFCFRQWKSHHQLRDGVTEVTQPLA